MRKTGKKKKKFNKFIWFYWKMKKKILFFVVFPVARMRKKNRVAGTGLSYCPIFSKF